MCRRIGVGGENGEPKELAFIHHFVSNGCNFRRAINLRDGDMKFARIQLRWRPAVGRVGVEIVGAGSVILSRNPGENTGGRIDARAFWRTRPETERQRLRWAIRIGGGDGEREKFSFVHGSIRDVRHGRPDVHFIDHDEERLRRAEAWRAAVGRDDLKRIGAGAMRFIGEPGDEPARADACTCRRVGAQGERDGLKRQI